MPWHVARSSSCPASRPWAVIKDADGEVEGCHASQEAAQRQVAALYASEEKATLMQHKSFEVAVEKADEEEGTFDALVAVFGNVDSTGDRIMPGAFEKTLAAWRASGDPIPIILSHQHNDPWSHIGAVDPHDVVETERGLEVRNAKLDVKENEVAAQVHRLMKRRSLKEFSFGYRVPKGGEKTGKDGANELHEINPLVEIGPTLKGANPSTELMGVKAAIEKAQWTTAYINDLPDSSFLYIESGGSKDSDGKTTPRSLRHFPYKDASGKVDLPHLRNALSRIPQSNVPASVKDRLMSRARTILDNAKAEAPDEKSLRRASEERELRELTGDLPSADELAQESIEQLTSRVEQLSGGLDALRAGVKSPEGDASLRRRLQEQRLDELEVPEAAEPPGGDEKRLEHIEAELALVKAALEQKEPEPQPEPLTADQLRRKHQRDRLDDAKVPVGDGSPPAFESKATVELKAEVERLRGDLGEVKQLLEKQAEPPPPSTAEQRRADQEQRLKAAEVPELPPGPSELEKLTQLVEQQTAQIDQLKAQLDAQQEPPPKTEDELRRQDAEVRLRKADPPSGPSEMERLVELVQQQAEQFKGAIDALRVDLEALADPGPPSEEALRRRSASALLDGVPSDGAPKPTPIKELQDRLDKLVEAVGKHVELTEQRLTRIEDRPIEEPPEVKAGGQDSLRRRSEQVVLEVTSQGLSARPYKPPVSPQPAVDDGEDEKRLRKQSRDVMLEILNG